ncbi:MAG: filamentous hemagglutinin family protein [Nitrospirota bacterium]
MKISFFHVMMRLLGCVLVLFPHYALAGQVNIPGFYGSTVAPPPRTQLPVLQQPTATIPGVTVDNNTSQNQLVVHQTQPNVIIDWSSFDIGADAWTKFDQQGNANWSALNRIWSRDPSLIFGKLTADGKIYLINQNGILFGQGSIVNVNSLVASALNIHDGDFINNALKFKAEDYQQSGAGFDLQATVSNFGEITANGGTVFLMAPRVENGGTINAPAGQIGLVAGTDVQLLTPQESDTARSGYYVVINDDFLNAPMSTDPDFGRAVNREGGKLYADGGVAGMHGNNIDQWGVIRAVTAFQNKNGQVELRAAKKITTGVNSMILLPVDVSLDPVTGLPRTISDTFDIQPVVFIGGLSKNNNNDMRGGTNSANEIELRGNIVAPAGNVTLRATDRVYMESGSSIDVSGVMKDLPVAVVADAKLTSVELRDYYDQKNGVLQGEKITTSVTSGSSIGDISQALLTRDKTAYERLVGGDIRKYLWHDSTNQLPDHWVYQPQTGNIDMNVTNGDIIIKQGAALNLAGGLINYQSGLVDSTKLLSGTQIYDIGNAPANIQYNKLLGNYEKTYDGFGIRESYSGIYYGGASSLKTYVKGYAQGGDAGTLSLTASSVVLDGQLNGSVTRGTYQNAWTTRTAYGTDADYEEALMLSKAQGIETPRAGTLKIGNSGSTTLNNPTSISVLSQIDPQQLSIDNKLTIGSDPLTGPTLISATTLNNAKLGTVNLTADLTIDTAADAGLVLQPGGSFAATARRIDHEGSITVHGGEINLYAAQNNTSQLNANGTSNGASYEPLDERIIAGKKSVLDVSGERIDNSQAGTTGNAFAGSGRTNGGSVSLKDETDQGAGVFVQTGALMDVSGGYSIDQKGKVTGGNAGSLSIQGTNIELDGDLRGYALADPNGKLQGGAITLASTNITVAPASSIPQTYDWSSFDAASSDPQKSSVSAEMKDKFTLAENRFDDTGFTRITLNSQNDLIIDKNTTITPSLARMNNPIIGQTGKALIEGQDASGSMVPGRPDLMRLDDAMSYMAGPSSFTANAAKLFDGTLTSGNSNFAGNLKDVDRSSVNLMVSDGAVIQTSPGGSISLSGPNVTVQGMLDAPAGNISLSATKGDLLLGNGAKITAAGYNRPDPSSTPNGFDVNYQSMTGGNVSLTAFGSLEIDRSAIVDVSGSDVVQNTVLSNGKITTYKTASNPGSVSLSYGSDLNPLGSVYANHAQLEGLGGGSLAIAKTDATSGMDVTKLALHTTGFDDLTFRSAYSLIFSSNINNALIGRKLTLDAPEITGSGNNVALSAPWIVLTNTSKVSPPALTNSTSPTAGSFTLSGGWTDSSGVKHGGFIDVIGDVQIDGFRDVTLRTDRDIRLSQVLYDNNFTSGKDGNPGTVKNGILATTGNLVLDADRIYPGNYYSYTTHGSQFYPDLYSDYTVHSNGKVTLQHTIQNADITADVPIYSAGGSLTVEGLAGIDVEKGVTLAAPMGTITLNAPGKRIYLADGSVLTTAGSAEVMYGLIDPNNLWLLEDKSNPGINAGTTSRITQDSLPQKGITLNADEVVARGGSVIDVSGGGSIFGYKFQPGVEGSVDPLTKTGRYVVFKADSFPMPGTAVYLQGGGGLSAGMYTLLPLDAKNPQNARYAFLPGASIIEAQSGPSLPEQGALSKDGYPLVVGYSAVADTPIQGTRPQVFTVRTAAEVLHAEGSYVKPEPILSGDAGIIKISGNTMILDGKLKAAAGQGFQGGKISLSAANIIVQTASTSPLGNYFNFDTSFDDLLHPELQKLKGGLTMSADGLTGFREVDLGDAGSTNSITITSTAEAPTVLNASIISLAAKNQITIGKSSSLQAVTDQNTNSGEGVITLTTPGTLDIGSNAILHATHAVSLDANNVATMKGSLQSDNGALTLKSSAIFLDDGTRTDTGLHVTQNMWTNNFTGFQDITLVSNSGNNAGIQFRENFNLSAGNSLTLDASRIANVSQSPIAVTLEAPTINFKNSGTASTLPPDASMGASIFTAATSANAGGIGTINIGDGDVLFANFNRINLNSRNDLTLNGKGSLSAGNADLSISAARVVAVSTAGTNKHKDGTATTSLTPADFAVYAGANYHNDQNDPNPTNKITIAGNGNAAGPSSTQGGTLEFWGASIDQGGVIQADGGSIKLSAMGSGPADGVMLRSGSKILAQGTVDAPGGQVLLKSVNGGIVLDSSSLIDVSAGSQGDAGLISLQSPIGGVLINGSLMAAAHGGAGGSFILDTSQLADIDMTRLIGTLSAGGFTESVDMRARKGNIDIASTDKLTAHLVKLTEDDPSKDANGVLLTDSNGNPLYGNINVAGRIEVSQGGSVELYAMNDLNIQSGGSIRAVSSTSGSLDANVLLSSSAASININGKIDVSGSDGTAPTGVVYLRAQCNLANNDLNATIASGAIAGASAVYAEAVRSYDISSSTPDLALPTGISDATTFYTNYMNNTNRFGTGINNFHLLPGIELVSNGNIDLNAAWDATTSRFGGEPGVLTIRAAGDLNINNNLADSPSGYNITSAPSGQNSWGFDLVAGADLSSADHMAVNNSGAGNLSFANNVIVYTETAPIRIASGKDTIIGVADQPPGYMLPSYMMNYSLASFTGSIRGNVGRDLIVAGAIQTATGDIDINIGRDLNLLVGNDTNNAGAGAIRTTGRLSAAAAAANWGDNPFDPMVIALPGSIQSDIYQTYYWRYDKGGNINLSVGRQAGKLNSSGQWVVADKTDAWDYFSPIEVSFPLAGNGGSATLAYYGVFSADYVNGTAGLATMGGGKLAVRTGGDFLAQAGTFGTGDLTIYSGGDIKGRFLNHGSAGEPGRAEIHAMGNFGAFDKQAQIELFNSRMNVTAQGEMQIGAVLNPTLASDKIDESRNYFVQCTYMPETSIKLKAGTDVTIAGNSPYYANDPTGYAKNYERVLPATVNVDAGGDIMLRNDFTLASFSKGDLSLDAGADVIGQVLDTAHGTYRSATILMSDISTQNWYGLFYIGNPDSPEKSGQWISKRTSNLHGLYDPTDNTWSFSEPLHAGDDQAITVHADEDIKGLNMKFSKKAEVTAGRDIVDITYEGQNITSNDVAMIRAGRDISIQYVKASSQNSAQGGLIQGGPGVFLVQAAGSIDLGSLSDGIQEIGNGNNPALGAEKSSLVVLSGYGFDKPASDIQAFFNSIRTAGDTYAGLMADGKLDEASQLLQTTRTKTIAPLLDAPTGAGDINMTSSQISTSNAASDIFVIANGNLNLGKTALPSASVVNTTTGITTANGGAINIFAVKDINVQESRVMTFFSRQDMVDPTKLYGDITVWSDQGNINAGRGSRTAVNASPPKRKQVPGLTGVYETVFTPPAVGSGMRALTYGDNPPVPGNVHLFAPTGVIDAGEAGIAGGQITLAALKVNNASNITFSAGSIGVPQSSEGTASLGTLAGTGITQNTQMNTDASGIGVSRAQASQMVEDIIAKWLDVKVVDFVEDDNDKSKEE